MDPIARARLNSSLLETLAALLQRRVRDPRVDGVTLTAVQVARDLSVAQVYYSVLGDDETRRVAQKGLENVAGFLRGEVGRLLHIRNAPLLRFHFDASLEEGNRIESLLREIHERDQQDPTQKPAAPEERPDGE
jgi:ribosome-binding factor A